MNRTKWFLAAICVTGWIALYWSIDWFVAKLSPKDHPARMAYVPDESIPPVDLAAAQRGWPSNLTDAGERRRMMAYMHDTKGTVPRPSPDGSGSKEPEPLPDLGTLLANAVAADGATKARACISCHDFNSGGPDRIGPNLWGVVGRDIAGKPGFAYSNAMSETPGSWTYEMLFEFLGSPARSVPGTKMTFAGMRRPQDRAAVIKYLATLGGNPLPLPEPKPDVETVAAADPPH